MSSLNQKELKELKLPKYEDIEVSTQTIIVMTNISLSDFKKIGNSLPIYPYIVNRKRRGRKSKKVEEDKNIIIPAYSILSIDLGSEIIGIDSKNKDKKKKECFRNSFSIYMTTGEYKKDDKPKMINLKICKNGKITVTGCKNELQAENCIKRFWEYIKDDKELYKFNDSNDTCFRSTFIHAMCNIDFSLDIKINREQLNQYFERININSLLETSIGYTGVIVKFQIDKNIEEPLLKQLSYEDGKETEYLVLYNNIVVGRYSNIADANFNCSELANCKNKSEIKAFFKNWHQDIVNLVFFPKSSDNWKINLEKYQLLNIPMAATQAELDELQECRLNECKDEEQRKLLQEKWAEYQEELGNKQQFDKQKNCIDVDKFTVRPISNGEWSANVSHLKHDVYLKSMPERDQLKK